MKFSDPKMPGYKEDPAEPAVACDASGCAVAAASRRAAGQLSANRNGVADAV